MSAKTELLDWTLLQVISAGLKSKKSWSTSSTPTSQNSPIYDSTALSWCSGSLAAPPAPYSSWPPGKYSVSAWLTAPQPCSASFPSPHSSSGSSPRSCVSVRCTRSTWGWWWTTPCCEPWSHCWGCPRIRCCAFRWSCCCSSWGCGCLRSTWSGRTLCTHWSATASIRPLQTAPLARMGVIRIWSTGDVFVCDWVYILFFCKLVC